LLEENDGSDVEVEEDFEMRSYEGEVDSSIE
jgi:hypothetical protein